MKKLDPTDIIFEDYEEVSAEKYALYYEQDTMVIRWRAYAPHYFVRKDAVGTKEKMKEDLEKQFFASKDRVKELIEREDVPAEKLRQEIEKIFLLRVKYSQVFFPILDTLIENLHPLKEKLNVKQ